MAVEILDGNKNKQYLPNNSLLPIKLGKVPYLNSYTVMEE